MSDAATEARIAAAERTMKDCQRGTHRLDRAHDILADCYGTIGGLIHRLRNPPKPPPWVHTGRQRRDELLASANYWRDRALAAEGIVRAITFVDRRSGVVANSRVEDSDLRQWAPGIERIAR